MSARRVIAGFLFAVSACLPSFAARASDAAVTAWQQDQALLRQTVADVQAGGILALKSHVPALEQALDGAQLVWYGKDNTIVLTDGLAETIAATAALANDKTHKTQHVDAMESPYQTMSLFLGSYYDEIGRPQDALRVLDKGLALSALPGVNLGAHRPYLVCERGAALNGLKRWNDALANYDDGLKAGNAPALVRAIMYRGRGFDLTELNRLDEAKAAYEESLKLDPGNSVALHELAYIAGLKAGEPKAPPALKSVQKQSKGDGTGAPAKP